MAAPFACAAGQVRSTAPTPDTFAVIDAGPFGSPAGTTAADAALGALHPTLFFARTVNVYDVPLLSPVNVCDVVVELWVPALVRTS